MFRGMMAHGEGLLTLSTPTRGPPPVGCPLTITQHIRSYSPYLAVVSSILSEDEVNATSTEQTRRWVGPKAQILSHKSM
jgi:hypothetical protein